MAQIDWNAIMNGVTTDKKRYHGANVRFFFAYNENKQKTAEAGRAIFDEIPSISIRWPGGDETVRRIEPQDMQDYPDAYKAFIAGSEPVDSGTPLAEWPAMNGSAMRELQYLGFKTVEQLANADDNVRRKLGTLSKFIQMAKDWLAASDSSQMEVMALKQQLEREQKRTSKLEEQLEILIQRVEANEGTDLRAGRQSIRLATQVDDIDDDIQSDIDEDSQPKRRGRPRKI